MNPSEVQNWIIEQALQGDDKASYLCDMLAMDRDGRLTAYILYRVGIEVIPLRTKRSNKHAKKNKN